MIWVTRGHGKGHRHWEDVPTLLRRPDAAEAANPADSWPNGRYMQVGVGPDGQVVLAKLYGPNAAPARPAVSVEAPQVADTTAEELRCFEVSIGGAVKAEMLMRRGADLLAAQAEEIADLKAILNSRSHV